MEKEKKQLENKLDKLDRLSRALQQERSDLQATIKNLSKPSTTAVSTSSTVPTTTTAAAAVSSTTTSAENDSSVPVTGSYQYN